MFQHGKHAFEIDAGNVSDFDLSAIITGFDHLVTVHNLFSINNRRVIRDFISKEVGCTAASDCQVLVAHSERKREDAAMPAKQHKSSNVDALQSLCAVTSDALCSAHCYILHSEDELYRLSGNDSKFESRFATPVNEEKSDEKQSAKQTMSIDFGVSPLRWLPFHTPPTFVSFGEELINNPSSTLDWQKLDEYKLECLEKIKGTTYTLNEMLSLKLYADTTQYQSSLRRAHWTTAPISTRRQFYHWANTMYQAHLYHAVPIPTKNGRLTRSIYHGLTKLFTVDQEMPIYYGPFSTTLDENVANSFSKNTGLIFLIKSSYANLFKLCVGIDMQWISCFKNEKEILLFNQVIPIESTTNFENDAEVLMLHLFNTLQQRKTRIIDADKFYKELGVRFDDAWMSMIVKRPSLLSRPTQFEDKTVQERLWSELHVCSPYMWHMVKQSKLEFCDDLECQVEFLLTALVGSRTKIVDIDAFIQKLGFKSFDDQWRPHIIKRHKSNDASSMLWLIMKKHVGASWVSSKKNMFGRLFKELQIHVVDPDATIFAILNRRQFMADDSTDSETGSGWDSDDS